MKEILFANTFVLGLVFALGYGLSTFLTPKKLQTYTLWLAPWFTIMTLGIVMTISSLAGVAGKYSAPILTIFLLLLSIIAWLKRPRYQVVGVRDIFLALIMLASIFVNQSPLIKSQKLLTLVSLGNNDALVYASAPEYLRDHTILENLVLDRQEATYDYEGVQNLIQNPYRWGTPAIMSYFLTMSGLEGYQLAYVFQVILLGLTVPLSYIFFVLIFGKESLIGLLLTTGLVALNAHTLYMLYHNFAGQVLFWGIELFFLVNLFVYFSARAQLTAQFQKTDLVLGATLATLYFSYHEGAIFLIVPLAVFWGLNLITRNKDLILRYWLTFMKIGVVTFTFAGLAVVHGVFYDYRQSKLVLGPIGWQVFREKVPFANPFEMTGLWSIHSLPPLPTLLAIFLSTLVVLIFAYGIKRSKYPKLLTSYTLIYLVLALWVSILHPNFFAYNRVITYVLPVLTPILVCGFMYATERYRRLRIILMVIALGLASYSGAKLNLQFMRNNLAADRSLISLTELANNSEIGKTIYLDDVFTKNGNYWRQIWTGYFLYPQKEVISTINPQIPSTGIPEDALVLISKSPWYGHGNLLLTRIAWENGFYRLGTVCTSDTCLLGRSEDLTHITFGEGKYEDSLLLSGWAAAEGDHRWVNQEEATVRLVSGKTAPTRLTFVAHSLMIPQEVNISVDGEAIDTLDLSSTFATYTIPLPPKAHHLYHVSFRFSQGYVPGGNDPRTLYGNFARISLE